MKFLAPEWHDELPSTNAALAAALARNPALPSGTTIAARRQTAGRGRFDRRWVSAPGRDLACSFLVRFPPHCPSPAALPMATALGVCRLIEVCGTQPRLKWPNDVLIGGRKACGILAEFHDLGVGGHAAVVGVGLNVNMSAEETKTIDRPATSLLIETGQTWDVEDLLRLLQRKLSSPLDHWARAGFAGIRQEWELRCDDRGRTVTVSGLHDLTGTVTGCGEDGELLLRDAQGTTHAVWSGDVTLRPRHTADTRKGLAIDVLPYS